MKEKTTGIYQVAKTAKVEVHNYDKHFWKIIQHPVCSCDHNQWIILRKRPAEKLLAYLKKDYEHTIYKLVLECPEIHYHRWLCKNPCWFRMNYPEIMVKVYRKLAAEKKWKIRMGYYEEQGGDETSTTFDNCFE